MKIPNNINPYDAFPVHTSGLKFEIVPYGGAGNNGKTIRYKLIKGAPNNSDPLYKESAAYKSLARVGQLDKLQAFMHQKAAPFEKSKSNVSNVPSIPLFKATHTITNPTHYTLSLLYPSMKTTKTEKIVLELIDYNNIIIKNLVLPYQIIFIHFGHNKLLFMKNAKSGYYVWQPNEEYTSFHSIEEHDILYKHYVSPGEEYDIETVYADHEKLTPSFGDFPYFDKDPPSYSKSIVKTALFFNLPKEVSEEQAKIYISRTTFRMNNEVVINPLHDEALAAALECLPYEHRIIKNNGDIFYKGDHMRELLFYDAKDSNTIFPVSIENSIMVQEIIRKNLDLYLRSICYLDKRLSFEEESDDNYCRHEPILGEACFVCGILDTERLLYKVHYTHESFQKICLPCFYAFINGESQFKEDWFGPCFVKGCERKITEQMIVSTILLNEQERKEKEIVQGSSPPVTVYDATIVFLTEKRRAWRKLINDFILFKSIPKHISEFNMMPLKERFKKSFNFSKEINTFDIFNLLYDMKNFDEEITKTRCPYCFDTNATIMGGRHSEHRCPMSFGFASDLEMLRGFKTDSNEFQKILQLGFRPFDEKHCESLIKKTHYSLEQLLGEKYAEERKRMALPGSNSLISTIKKIPLSEKKSLLAQYHALYRSVPSLYGATPSLSGKTSIYGAPISGKTSMYGSYDLNKVVRERMEEERARYRTQIESLEKEIKREIEENKIIEKEKREYRIPHTHIGPQWCVTCGRPMYNGRHYAREPGKGVFEWGRVVYLPRRGDLFGQPDYNLIKVKSIGYGYQSSTKARIFSEKQLYEIYHKDRDEYHCRMGGGGGRLEYLVRLIALRDTLSEAIQEGVFLFDDTIKDRVVKKTQLYLADGNEDDGQYLRAKKILENRKWDTEMQGPPKEDYFNLSDVARALYPIDQKRKEYTFNNVARVLSTHTPTQGNKGSSTVLNYLQSPFSWFFKASKGGAITRKNKKYKNKKTYRKRKN